MTKHLPADTLIMLHNRLASLTFRNPKRLFTANYKYRKLPTINTKFGGQKY